MPTPPVQTSAKKLPPEGAPLPTPVELVAMGARIEAAVATFEDRVHNAGRTATAFAVVVILILAGIGLLLNAIRGELETIRANGTDLVSIFSTKEIHACPQSPESRK